MSLPSRRLEHFRVSGTHRWISQGILGFGLLFVIVGVLLGKFPLIGFGLVPVTLGLILNFLYDVHCSWVGDTLNIQHRPFYYKSIDLTQVVGFEIIHYRQGETLEIFLLDGSRHSINLLGPQLKAMARNLIEDKTSVAQKNLKNLIFEGNGLMLKAESNQISSLTFINSLCLALLLMGLAGIMQGLSAESSIVLCFIGSVGLIFLGKKLYRALYESVLVTKDRLILVNGRHSRTYNWGQIENVTSSRHPYSGTIYLKLHMSDGVLLVLDQLLMHGKSEAIKHILALMGPQSSEKSFETKNSTISKTRNKTKRGHFLYCTGNSLVFDFALHRPLFG